MCRLGLPVVAVAVVAGAIVTGCSSPSAEHTCEVTLSYDPGDVQVQYVQAIGDWNEWTYGRTPLEREGTGPFQTKISLPLGRYHYQLVVDGNRMLDPRSKLSAFDRVGDEERSVLIVADCRAPRLEATRLETSTESMTAAIRFVPGTDGQPIDEASLSVVSSTAGAVDVEVGGADITIHSKTVVPGKHQLAVLASDTKGRSTETLRLPFWVEEQGRFDWQGALIYEVVVDRFALSGPPLDEGLTREEALTRRHGGDLYGLAEVLDRGYFEALGVAALWISPVYDNPETLWLGSWEREYQGYHGYWPIDSRAVEPLFGGEGAFEELVAAAHDRGIRVILDVVPNHVHTDNPVYVTHIGDGWFNGDGDCVCGVTCSWQHDLDRCWFTPYLADYRWRNEQVAQVVTDDVLYWVERFDIDGLRVDAVPMMPRAASRRLAYETARRFEQGPLGIHLLGETYTGADGWEMIASYLGPDGLDGQFDFPFMWSARRVIAQGQGSFEDLDRAIRQSELFFGPSGAVMSKMVGNHDVPRFLSEAAGDDLSDPWNNPPAQPSEAEPYQRLVLAQTLVLTLPGAPVIYYGDELGLPGAGDPDNRRVMRFDTDLTAFESETLETIQRLGRFRACSTALRNGARRTLLVTDDQYAFLRDDGGGSPVVVVLNRASDQAQLAIDLPMDVSFGDQVVLTDVIGGTEVTREDQSLPHVHVPPLGALVLSAGHCI